jgi:DNA-directed RNA polymerase subunit RPC12/RpoP
MWAVTYIGYETGDRLGAEYDLGRFHTEDAAKAAAQDAENKATALAENGGVVPLADEDDCTDACLSHAPDCDGYCNHDGIDGKRPHVNACLPDMTQPSSNTNCLDGIRCPYCGSEDSFDIEAKCTVRVSDDGTDEGRGFEWDENSAIACTDCGHADRVSAFTIRTKTA